MSTKVPEGMIPMEEFAKRKGIAPDKVIKMIKDGFYSGQLVGERWYVEPSEASAPDAGPKPRSGPVAGEGSEYDVARLISKVMAFFGWLLVLVGLAAGALGIAAGIEARGGGMSILGILPGLGIAVAGLLLVAAGQVTRAMVDNADHTREILKLARAQMKPA